MIDRLRGRRPRMTLAVLWLTLPVAAGAEPADPWQTFVGELARAGEVIHRKETPADPITRAEGYRYLSRLIRRGLETALEFDDPAHPHLFRANTRSMLTGGTTADAVYVHGFIDGSRTYKIRGDRGTAPLIEFTVYSGMLGLHPDSGKLGALTEESLAVEADGSYEVVLSPKPHPGNWIRTGADARYVFIRQYTHDWSATRPATHRIEVVGEQSQQAPPSVTDVRDGLQTAAEYVRNGALVWASIVDRSRKLPANVLVAIPEQGDTTMPAGDKFASGHFALAAEEALVMEFTPPEAPYWGVQLTNYWFEPIDYGGTGAHVNNRTARFEPGGSVRLVVAHAARPADPNWLSTGGRTVGTMQFRLSRSRAAVPAIRTRVVKLSEL